MKKTLATIVVLALCILGTSSLFAADGAALYKSKCASCHGADGSKTKMGSTPMRALGSPEVQKQTDEELTAWTAKGKGKMPAYEAKLSADDIKALVAHMRTLKQ